MIAENKKKH